MSLSRFSVRRIVGAFLGLTVFISVLAGAFSLPAPAQAASSGCANYRCWTVLNRNETQAFAYRRWTPRVHPRLQPVVNLAAAAHRWIARRYYERGSCIAFIGSVRPWESQGMVRANC